MYRSRAEETQRSNETLKIQVQNMNERVRNLEQVHETNLNSIARKDKKVEELRNELHNERTKRQDAEVNASTVNQAMQDERENHNREQAKTQEIAKFHETQYEVLSSTTKRDKADLNKRFKTLFAELQTLAQAQKTQHVSFDRLDVIAEQKNREIDTLKETNEKLLACHADYKKYKDNELRGEIERSHANNDSIEATLEAIKEVQSQMRWAIQINDMEKERASKKEKLEHSSK
jgi:chromosome segregation ATPase